VIPSQPFHHPDVSITDNAVRSLLLFRRQPYDSTMLFHSYITLSWCPSFRFLCLRL
jgi:hypothetical protein